MRTICVQFAYKKVSFRVKINHIFAEKDYKHSKTYNYEN